MDPSPRRVPRPSLEEVRGQLKQMGYLKGPLSGWLAGGSGGPSTLWRINLLASLRAGLIGGPLLGVPAAAWVALANRPHFTSPRDLLLLALYTSVALGIAFSALEFVVDATLGWMARRGVILVGRAERLAGRVGLLFTAVSTLYLAYLLRGGRMAALATGAGTGPGLPAWLLWVAALGLVLAVGHLVGRVSRLGLLISLAAAAGAGALGRARAGGRPRRWLAGATIVLLGAAALLVFGPAGRGGGNRPPVKFETTPFPGRILFIGIDGLDEELLDRMIAAGACPHLGRMAGSGWRYPVASIDPRVPPAVWTSIATGRPPEEHGVLGYQAGRLPGIRTGLQERASGDSLAISFRLLFPPLFASAVPVSSGFRRVPAVWEILADGGVETAAVNWWATWPADGTEATIVSERAFPRLLAGAPPDRDVAPPALQEALAAGFEADMERVRRGLEEAGLNHDDGPAARAALIDGYHALVGRRLVDSGLVRVLMLYLPGLDIARGSAGSDAAPETTIGLARHLDQLVGALVTAAGPEDIVLLAGDPGRSGSGRGRRGVLLVTGGRVRPGSGQRFLSPLDLAPTVLALAGFPLARDLSGTAVTEFLDAGDPATRPVPPIPTFGERVPAAASAARDDFDEEVLERLRSLGYIQ